MARTVRRSIGRPDFRAESFVLTLEPQHRGVKFHVRSGAAERPNRQHHRAVTRRFACDPPLQVRSGADETRRDEKVFDRLQTLLLAVAFTLAGAPLATPA